MKEKRQKIRSKNKIRLEIKYYLLWRQMSNKVKMKIQNQRGRIQNVNALNSGKKAKKNRRANRTEMEGKHNPQAD